MNATSDGGINGAYCPGNGFGTLCTELAKATFEDLHLRAPRCAIDHVVIGLHEWCWKKMPEPPRMTVLPFPSML